MGPSGRILSQRPVAEAIASDSLLMDHKRTRPSDPDGSLPEKDEEVMKAADDGKLVLAEEKSEGRVSFASMRVFLDDVASPWPVLFWAAYLFGGLATHVALTLEPW
jgi:hypothetical protein